MHVVYRGPSERVFIPGNPDIEFPQGEPVEVDDDLGARLIQQATFEPVKRAKEKES